jgi:outer membrane protein OmpA-like peptidoglycan-associated protein
MTRSGAPRLTSLAVLSILACAFIATTTIAETTKVEGVIVGRSGNVMIVEYTQNAELAFLLDDNTKVSQVGGVFKMRDKSKSMAALIPGLKVKVEGTYNDSRQVIATSVKFKGDDLEQAQIAEAANRQSHNESRQQLEEHNAELERQAAALKQQNEQLQLQAAQLAEHKAQIDAAVARFGQLDDYYIFDELTVYFDNGKVKVDPKYEAPLLELAKKAESVDGYVISVTGYASSSGSTSVNQKLSEDRAGSVTNILLQNGHVPLTRILAPGAMGEAHQTTTDKSAEGQAENRRVVVRVLQNKAIAGV